MKLIVHRAVHVGGRRCEPGDTVEVAPADAGFVIANGRAAFVDPADAERAGAAARAAAAAAARRTKPAPR
ncbi:MAG: hypothetical protein KF683_00890 [Rubrivivax sp.]|nr:hypothetical protein [Rubrivivax sp.]